MTFDPTQNRIQTMHLTADELAALKAAKHGWEYLYPDNGLEWVDMPDPQWLNKNVYRAKPAPAPTITSAELLAAAAELPEVRALVDVLTSIKSAWILPSADQLALEAALAPFARKGE